MNPSQLPVSDPVATAPIDTTIAAATEEEQEVLHASIKAGSVAQIVIAIVAVLGLIYIAKVFLVTFLASLLLAFMLEPLVQELEHIRVPRPVGAMVAVLLLSSVAGGLTYFFLQPRGGFCQRVTEVFH